MNNETWDEIWYVIETSLAGADDWFTFTGESFDSVDSAADRIISLIEQTRGQRDQYEYRVVRKTLISEVVGTATPKEGKQ